MGGPVHAGIDFVGDYGEVVAGGDFEDGGKVGDGEVGAAGVGGVVY